jgi:amino acid permease
MRFMVPPSSQCFFFFLGILVVWYHHDDNDSRITTTSAFHYNYYYPTTTVIRSSSSSSSSMNSGCHNNHRHHFLLGSSSRSSRSSTTHRHRRHDPQDDDRVITRLQHSTSSNTVVSIQDDDDSESLSSSPNPTATGTGTGTGGTATIVNEIFNLVKSIVGAGVLTLPYGIASFGNAPSAVVPAILLITLIGTMSGYGFGLIGRVCAMTHTTSYKSAWESSVSVSTSWIPAVAVTLKTIFSTLAYSMILADTFQALSIAAGWQISKTILLVTMTTGILLPLCLLKNLSSLAPFSFVGGLGMVYTAVAMGIRYYGGSYTVPHGRFLSDLPLSLRPSFGTIGAVGALSPVTSILLGMLSTAYMAHFNAPKFYTELKNNTIPRYLTVVSASFGIAIGLFATIGTIGFLTFGGHASGLILNNYSTKDVLMSLSRVAVAVSLVGSYPLAFVGARDGLLDLFAIQNKTPRLLNTITVALLSTLTVAALIIPDVSFVLAFAGYVPFCRAASILELIDVCFLYGEDVSTMIYSYTC